MSFKEWRSITSTPNTKRKEISTSPIYANLSTKQTSKPKVTRIPPTNQSYTTALKQKSFLKYLIVTPIPQINLTSSSTPFHKYDVPKVEIGAINPSLIIAMFITVLLLMALVASLAVIFAIKFRKYLSF